MDIIKALEERAPGMKVTENVPMKDYTTLRVGGPAKVIAEVRRMEDVRETVKVCREAGLPVLVLGNGSNMLVSDAGFPGVVLLMKNNVFSGISVWDQVISVQAGALMSNLAKTACENGLTGLECVSGIPGTVGGGLFMNAGAYGGELGSCVQSVTVLLENGEMAVYSREEMRFSYRHSRPMEENSVVLGAEFLPERGDREEIAEKMRELNARRRDKQPLEYPSAGSFFKRPEGYFAGALIEKCGLKGTRVGGAAVSEKHAGFLINLGGATAKDFADLSLLVSGRVFDAFGVRLEPEVRFIGGNE